MSGTIIITVSFPCSIGMEKLSPSFYEVYTFKLVHPPTHLHSQRSGAGSQATSTRKFEGGLTMNLELAYLHCSILWRAGTNTLKVTMLTATSNLFWNSPTIQSSWPQNTSLEGETGGEQGERRRRGRRGTRKRCGGKEEEKEGDEGEGDEENEKEKERRRRSEMRRMERRGVTRKTGGGDWGRETEKRKEGGESICLGVHTTLKLSKASLLVYTWHGTLQSKLWTQWKCIHSSQSHLPEHWMLCSTHPHPFQSLEKCDFKYNIVTTGQDFTCDNYYCNFQNIFFNTRKTKMHWTNPAMCAVCGYKYSVCLCWYKSS